MSVISSGQITIIDLFDVPGLNAWISASQAVTQVYNNMTEAYNPNYATANQVLTLNLTKAGSATSLVGANCSDITWTKKLGTTTTTITDTTGNEFVGGTKKSVLTSKINTPTAQGAVTWTATGTWTDPDSGIAVAFSATITITVIQLAKAAILVNIYAPDGDFFRNNTPTSLKVCADLYKDGALSEGSKKIKWFAADSSIGTPQDADAGAGWRKITATTGATGAVANVAFDGATTGQGVLTVYPDAVLNAQTFLVIITDNAGGTIGTKVKQYFTLRDMDDPIMVVVDTTQGNILKNGIGSTKLIARLYQNGEEVDSGGTIYAYKWYKWQNGTMVTGFGGAGKDYKEGKELDVGSSDVQVKTVFKVEVETK